MKTNNRFKTLLRFTWSIVKRSWRIFPTFLLNPFDWFDLFADFIPCLAKVNFSLSPTLFWIIVGLVLFYAAFETYYEDRAVEPSLEIIFLDEKPFIHEYASSYKAPNRTNSIFSPTVSSASSEVLANSKNLQVSGLLYRIAVQNIGMGTIEDVFVKAESTEPFIETLSYLPANLHFMHDNVSPYLQEKSLAQGDLVYVDVIEQQFSSQTRKYQTFLRDTVARKTQMIPHGEFVLTLVAYGKNVPPTRRKFKISFENEVLNFSPFVDND